MVQNCELENYLFGLDPGQRGRIRKVKQPIAVIVVGAKVVIGTKQ